jgi:hypothetical protein
MFCDWRNLAQIATLLTQDERTWFGAYLRKRADELLTEAETKEDERRIRRAICSALSQPSLNRLHAYAAGMHFPTPKTVCSLAMALKSHPLSLLRFAGYDREAVRILDDLRVASRGLDRSGFTREVVEYAVRLFPRRGERYRERRVYADALLETSLPISFDGGAGRRPRAKPLAHAYEILGDASLEVDCRVAIAGELVRSWAYALDSTLARSIEQSAYVRIPRIGEPPPDVPLLAFGSLTSVPKARRR